MLRHGGGSLWTLYRRFALAIGDNFLRLLGEGLYPPLGGMTLARIVEEKEAARRRVRARNPEPQGFDKYGLMMFVLDGEVVTSPTSSENVVDAEPVSPASDLSDEQRAALRHALLYRAMALSSDDAVDELDRWAPEVTTFAEDDDRDTYALAHARRDANRGRPGAALAAIRARLKVAKLDGTCNRALHDAKAELLETLELEVPYVRTDDNIADFFTKPLKGKKFHAMRRSIMNEPDRAP